MPKTPMNENLSGKIAVVTGSSAGLGKEIALGLSRQGATVVMACRNLAKAEVAKAEIAAAGGKGPLELMALDVASLNSVRSFAAAFAQKHSQLDILVNNAGGWTQDRRTSADGIELIWATNVLGPELLTQLLLPQLKAAEKARVINVSSTVAGGLDLNDVEYKTRKYSGMSAYSQSKQANRMLSWALDEQLKGSGITANAMSPGLVKTTLNRDITGGLKFFFSIMVPLIGKTAPEGADTAIWLASDPALEAASGKFYENRKEQACKYKSDMDSVRRLQKLCAGMAAGKG